jgi:ATP-dependent Lon protease
LKLPVLPLEDAVILPGMVVPLALDEPEVRTALEAAQLAGEPALLALLPRLDGRYASIGTLAEVDQIGRLPSGQKAAVVRASDRIRVGTGTTGPGSALWVEAEVLSSAGAGSERVAELTSQYRALVVAQLERRGAFQMIDGISRITDPSALADTAGWAPYLDAGQKQRVLETLDVAERLELVVGWARDHLAEQEVADRIRKDVSEGMDRQQREFLLRQQLAAIRKELRDLDGKDAGEDEPDLRARVQGAGLPDAARTAVLAELDRLERTSDQSPEASWIRTWIDTVIELPWSERTEDRYDLAAARAVLDADHAGLEEVKDRIVEHLAVRKRREERGLGVVGGRRSGAVLVLVGPPGVGKTSLGESLARAMGRKFVRVALGGVRDEAEIRGHRRTYVGALPGRIVRAIREAGSMNPVMLLDEVDKLGTDYRGDPASALLEVLDPAQNHTFRDHYLDLDLDLSDVVFVATANVAESIPEPLLDRMELIRLDGYTEDEKVTIAREHLLPKQLERAGLEPAEVTLSDAAIARLAGVYTREAGVRGLERLLARILRKVAAGGGDDPVTVDEDGLVPYLGRPRHEPEVAMRTAVPGVATGLAVTGAGGDVLFVEAALAAPASGTSGVTLTGQLGEVMKESAQIALSYLRSHGDELGIDVSQLEGRGVHIHVPAGAVPKDGPSAGVTMTTALASLLSGRTVRTDVAMTGEVSLTGRVLPIGGVKQKLLAADRAGITTVLIPSRNEPDLDDLPAEVLDRLTVRPVGDVREVLELALAAPERAGELTGVAA